MKKCSFKQSFSSADVSVDTEKLNKILDDEVSSEYLCSDDGEAANEYSSHFEDSDETTEGLGIN